VLGEPSFPQLRCLWSASKTAKAEQKKGNWLQVSRICNLQYLSGWWFQPLWKIWVRQLGWLFHSQLIWKVIKIHGSKAPTSGYIVVYSEFSHSKWWFPLKKCDFPVYLLTIIHHILSRVSSNRWNPPHIKICQWTWILIVILLQSHGFHLFSTPIKNSTWWTPMIILAFNCMIIKIDFHILL
jgi:hypothetical protein